MRLVFAAPLVLLAAVGCTDEPSQASQPLTAPVVVSRLTLKTLPANAPSICRANVAARDALILAEATKSKEAKLASLDAVIADVCY